MKAMKSAKPMKAVKARTAAKFRSAAIWAAPIPLPPHQPGFDGFSFTSRVRDPEARNIPRALGPGTTTLAIYVPRESAATLSTELTVAGGEPTTLSTELTLGIGEPLAGG